mgnify:CR=1 FL=1
MSQVALFKGLLSSNWTLKKLEILILNRNGSKWENQETLLQMNTTLSKDTEQTAFQKILGEMTQK